MNTPASEQTLAIGHTPASEQTPATGHTPASEQTPATGHTPAFEQTSSSIPSSYQEFVHQLNEACSLGDRDSKRLIENLAPLMATTLKEAKEFCKPKIMVDGGGSPQNLISESLTEHNYQ